MTDFRKCFVQPIDNKSLGREKCANVFSAAKILSHTNKFYLICNLKPRGYLKCKNFKKLILKKNAKLMTFYFNTERRSWPYKKKYNYRGFFLNSQKTLSCHSKFWKKEFKNSLFFFRRVHLYCKKDISRSCCSKIVNLYSDSSQMMCTVFCTALIVVSADPITKNQKHVNSKTTFLSSVKKVAGNN